MTVSVSGSEDNTGAAPPQAQAPVVASPDANAAPATPAATEGHVSPAAGAPSIEKPAEAPAAEQNDKGSAPVNDSEPTLLEQAEGLPAKDAKKPAEEPAPADAKKPDGDKKPDEQKAAGDKKPEAKAEGDDPAKEATAVAPPAPITYEAFKLPEGVKLEDKKLKEFTDIVGARQLPQDDAQKLVDLYIADINEMGAQYEKNQREVWNKTNDAWKTELRNDQDLGGNRVETSLKMAKAVIELYGGTKEQQTDLLAHTRLNGMGNYIGYVRMLNNLAQALNVYEDFIVPAAATAPKEQRGPGNRNWYNNQKGNGASA